MTALLAPVLLSACDDPAPTGQVLASVGGVVITQRDFEAARASAGAAPLDRAEIIDRLIDRALLLRLAHDHRLHLSPEHLAARRRAEEESLIALYRQQVGALVPQPSETEISSLVADRPWMFANRQQLVTDSIELDPATDLRALAVLPTLDAIAASLSASRTRFERTAAVVDSGALPDAEARLLVAATPGRPLMIRYGERNRMVSVMSRIPAPITGEVARRVARAVLLRMRIDRRLAQQVADARARATIRYRPDLAPAQR